MGHVAGRASRVHRRMHLHAWLLPRLTIHAPTGRSTTQLRMLLHVLWVMLHLSGRWPWLHLRTLMRQHTTHAILMVGHELRTICTVKLRRLARGAVLLQLLLLKLLLLLLHRWMRHLARMLHYTHPSRTSVLLKLLLLLML